MNALETVGHGILENKGKITADAFIRFELTGLHVSERMHRASFHLVEALALALKTEDTHPVSVWAHNERNSAPALHLRELGHAACMAIAAEAARSFAPEFRGVMATLQKAEGSIATAVRDADALRVAA